MSIVSESNVETSDLQSRLILGRVPAQECSVLRFFAAILPHGPSTVRSAYPLGIQMTNASLYGTLATAIREFSRRSWCLAGLVTSDVKSTQARNSSSRHGQVDPTMAECQFAK